MNKAFSSRERIFGGIIILLLGSLIYSLALNEKQETAIPIAYDADAEQYTWQIDEFVTGLRVPWDLQFTPDGQLVITEREGTVKIRQTDGTITTVSGTPEVASVGESGMTGLTLHPDFATNKLLYLYYTYRQGGQIFNRVSQFALVDNHLKDEKIILNNLPGGSIHNGGRMRFGPDKKLWVLTGDAGTPNTAQNRDSLGGKVLRLNDDGSVPSDNPTFGSLIYSLGHRNPQGLAWHPLTEELIATEHGESAHDEVNNIKPNQNYGWPDVRKCSASDSKFTDPILCSQENTWAPSGIAALGTNIWRFRYSFVFAGLRGNLLKRIAVVDGKVVEEENIIQGTYGRLRAVITDKDGNSYVSTSNYDGRGLPKPGDDRILKVTPIKRD